MKRATLISTVLVLAGAAAWFAPWTEPSAAGRKDVTLTDQSPFPPAGRATSPTADSGESTSTRARERAPEKKKPLFALLALIPSLTGEAGLDMETLKNIRTKLDSLEPEELLQVLQSLESSSAMDGDKHQLSSLIAGSLARRDPGLALDTFTPRLHGPFPEGPMRQLDLIYKMWLSQNPSAAKDWLDGQIAQGKLPALQGTGNNIIHPRMEFEFSLVRNMARLNAEEASARFSKLDSSEKNRLLSSDWFSGTNAANTKNVADFLRRQTGNDSEALAKAASMRLRQGDLDRASEFILQIHPTPAERAALASEALRTRIEGRDSLTMTPGEAREWIIANAPAEVDRLTGTALAQFTEWHDFSEMAALAAEYRDASGSEQVMAAFLANTPLRFRNEALKLSESISDPATRNEIRASLNR